MSEKSLPQPSSPLAKSGRFTRYSLIWAAAALVSLLYLVLLATQPALVADLLGASTETAEHDATQQVLGETVAEVRTLRDTIDLFRNELIEIRAQVSSQNDIARDLATRVATLEAEPAEPQKVAANEAASKTKEAAAAKKAAKDAPPAKKTAKAESNLETGSVAQQAAGAPITFGPPVVTPAATPPPAAPVNTLIGVQIATGPSVDSLRLSWTLLNERHGDTFRSLQPRYTTDMSGSERTFDLIVGPVASVDDARRLCQELAMKATPCTVSRFTGDAL
ncbi:hypothetical protein [Hyphomicrobium sp.]|uniref:hypothetical protein n=1 Tax=Hyphomicrobium sp. TaxID=82 RepID=UPI0025BFA6F1|nr:hypothetical protein [Hyphomicrobium sp.]MCC7250382.1 hypothetical protein [Hyphomicrobium sp.]